MPFGVVVWAFPSANFIGPGARTHEDERGEIEVGAFRGKRLLPFLAQSGWAFRISVTVFWRVGGS
jgi:hypothetical protein